MSNFWIGPTSLDQRQKAVLKRITESEGPHWISGYAGTGKTLLLALALKDIVKRTGRKSVCYITYTHSLCELAKSGMGDEIEVKTVDAFLSDSKSYDFLFIDEVQDLSLEKIKKIQKRSGHIVWAGDPAQSIYRGVVDMDDLPVVLRTKQQELKNIHRLSEGVFSVASAIYDLYTFLPGTQLLGASASIQMVEAEQQDDEFTWVWEKVKVVCRKGRPSAILFPSHRQIEEFANSIATYEGIPFPPKSVKPIGRLPVDYSEFNAYWLRKKIGLQFLGSGNGALSDGESDAVCFLMTYKSAKGLGFDSIFLPSLNASASFEDGKPVGKVDEMQRRFLFVALTRTQRDLFVSYSGAPHPYLKEIPKKWYKKITL